ncbi:MAG TPA: AtpZ/AtpI family protein [Firmicutes bacterium]|nr:AtpZ/AtpI family protein [Bacillota bacterium]
MIAGFYLGRLLDQRAGTHPWFSVSGFLVGALSGFWGTYKFIMSEFDDKKGNGGGRDQG